MAISTAVISGGVGMVLLLVLMSQGSNALKCVICNSLKNTDCLINPPEAEDCDTWCRTQKSFVEPSHNDPTDETLWTPCPDGDKFTFNVCRKVEYTLLPDPTTEDKETKRTVRACGFVPKAKDTDPDVKTNRLDRSTTVTYQCKTDGCNSGSALSAQILVIVSSALILLSSTALAAF